MRYSLIRRSATKARKEHVCIWCCHAVLAGSRYVREISTYDGHFQNFAWHEACREDADEYFSSGAGEEFTPGENEMPFHALYELDARSSAGGKEE